MNEQDTNNYSKLYTYRPFYILQFNEKHVKQYNENHTSSSIYDIINILHLCMSERWDIHNSKYSRFFKKKVNLVKSVWFSLIERNVDLCNTIFSFIDKSFYLLQVNSLVLVLSFFAVACILQAMYIVERKVQPSFRKPHLKYLSESVGCWLQYFCFCFTAERVLCLS